MFDPIAAAYDSVARGQAVAPALALVAGAVTAVGPCVAPRFVAVAAMTGTARGIVARLLIVAAIVGGMCVSYGAIASAGWVLAGVAGLSFWIYIAMAIGLAIAGIRAVAASVQHGHPCEHRAERRASLGGAFFMGISFGFVLSPCCTPIVAAIGGLAAAAGSPLFGCIVLVAFVAGHAAPLIALAVGAGSIRSLLTKPAFSSAIAAVSGGLLIFLAGYYAVLA